MWFAGWTSGKLVEAGGCGFVAEEEADAWVFSVALLFFISVYFVCGVVKKKLQGRSGPNDWLPNHHFWSSLYGLVVDGVAYILHGGKRAQSTEALLPQSKPTLQSPQPIATGPTIRRQEPLFTQVIEKYGNENQKDLKDELEHQGTAAARLGLKQLETQVLKQQLEKLGMPTTGTHVELKARVQQATRSADASVVTTPGAST